MIFRAQGMKNQPPHADDRRFNAGWIDFRIAARTPAKDPSASIRPLHHDSKERSHEPNHLFNQQTPRRRCLLLAPLEIRSPTWTGHAADGPKENPTLRNCKTKVPSQWNPDQANTLTNLGTPLSYALMIRTV